MTFGMNALICSILDFISLNIGFHVIKNNHLANLRRLPISQNVCITNKCYNYYGSNVYKLGLAKNIAKRMDGYITSYIDPVKIIFTIPVNNRFEAEKILFNKLQKYRIDSNREFFKCKKKIIITTMNEVADIINNNKKHEYVEKMNINNVPVIDTIDYTNYNKNYITLFDKLCCQKYDICNKLKMLKIEQTEGNIKFWHNNMNKLNNIICLHNLQPGDDLYARRTSYINKILGIYRFNSIADFNTVVKKDDELVKRMKDSKLLKYKNYKQILTDFNKRLQRNDKKSTFSLDRFTNFVNCVLNEYGIKVNTTRKQIRLLNNVRTREYTYNLVNIINY